MKRNKKKSHSKIAQSDDLQQEGHNERQNYKMSRWWFYFVMLFFIGTTVYIFFFSDFMRITSITVSGTEVLSESDVQQILQQELDHKFIGIIPRATFPFVAPHLMEKKLKETFRRIDTVHVQRVFPEKLVVVIVEHEAVLVWCRDHAKDDCYMIDRNGTAYERVDWSSPDIMQNDQVTIIDEKGYDVVMNDTILVPEYVEHLMNVRGAMGRASNVLFHEDIVVPSRISKEARLTTEEGWYMLVGLKAPLEVTERTVKTFFEMTEFEKARSELEYVDARIPQKVFYRYKGDLEELDKDDIEGQEKNEQSANNESGQ